MKRYFINEIFRSIQGEGLRAGTAATFIRFSKCNLDCSLATMGWDCDTEFDTGEWYDLGGLVSALVDHPVDWIIFTGGEPALQLDQPLVDVLHALGWKLAIETNGTKPLPKNLDWVCCSPKYERPVLRAADEVKCVVANGQEPEHHGVTGTWLVSPAFEPCDHDGDCEPPACPGWYLNPETLDWCIKWVKANPRWRLSTQNHKYWGIR